VRNLFDQAHVPFSKTDHHHTDEVRVRVRVRVR
jgi:hypothetical protein